MSKATQTPITTARKAYPTPRRNDLTGCLFGRWAVIRQLPERAPDRQIVWLCRCDCGTEAPVKAGLLRSGHSKSCGCGPIHGTTHPLYRRWYNMIERCTNPEFPDWPKYGARGIKVCDRWRAFENFLSDMEPSFVPGTQLDRINNAGHYEPGNVRWATPTTNIRNRRTTVMMETPWGRMPQGEAAQRLGISCDVLDSRRRRGWSYARLFGSTA